jgi:phosphoribosyl 1,2-cyclic phosphodiesterase
MQITVLGSGSGGNCTLVETDATAVLIDAGLSCRQITQRLAATGRSLERLAAILVTHEHGDHINGLAVLCKKRPIPVYANRLTADATKSIIAAAAGKPAAHIAWHLFTNGQGFSVGDLTIEAFSIPHDAQDPVGFAVHNCNASAGFVTDFGHPTRLVAERIRGLNALILESNHDVKMLQDNPDRSWSTKQRILSRHGHLSNEDAAKLAADILTDKLRHVALAHLSRDCNRPELAHRTVTGKLHQTGAKHVHVSLTNQDTPAPTILL